MALSVGELLVKANVSFGILGEKEPSDGNEVNRVGERGLYEYMARNNIALFQELGIKKVITLSPHAFNAFKNDYPQWGGDFQTAHYTQVLSLLIKENKLTSNNDRNIRVTFHDPCFLGRHNKEYEAPRQILKSVPGVELVEMERTRHDALCCGGGGGNFFTDMLGAGPQSPARVRVREATATGSDLLVTACPKCYNMLDDAVKTEEAQDRIAVRDISQIF
jgi:Fe-S oxidoreductase